MKPVDFIYDGKWLSEFNFMVCEFSQSSGISEEDAGSEITFVTVPRGYGSRYGLVHTKHEQCLETTFDICKNPTIFGDDNIEISATEFREISRWLNRKEYLLFYFLPDDWSKDEEFIYHFASFNLKKLMLDERLYGIRLEMKTDSPYAYGKEETYTWSATSDSLSHTVVDSSDEIGYIYPALTVTVSEDCDLTITNESEGCNSVIKNCKAGEIITMRGDTNIIETSLSSHDICDDFNYEFFRVGNTMSRTENVITVSNPCDISITYRPIRKYSQV